MFGIEIKPITLCTAGLSHRVYGLSEEHVYAVLPLADLCPT